MQLLQNAPRIVFLGDSITYDGQYLAWFESWLLTRGLADPPIIINAGLPSETVSGLSEDGHAGGKFPRPDLAERLERVLADAQPDLVFACYGINCGIYQPFDEQRFLAYQEGIINLRARVEATGATLILVTPPCYDDQRSDNHYSYNAVLDQYSGWLTEQNKIGWNVIDLHHPMNRELARQRQLNPGFSFQPDAVHPNPAGHWFIASELIRWFADEQAAEAGTPEEMLASFELPVELFALVRQRQTVRRDAILTAAGHKRPGIAAGLPVGQAEEQIRPISEKIRAFVDQQSIRN
jgi:lysophospholipase L1-like esterase